MGGKKRDKVKMDDKIKFLAICITAGLLVLSIDAESLSVSISSDMQKGLAGEVRGRNNFF